MDTGEDASVNTLDKTGSSGIDITSGSKKQQERGSTEASKLIEMINLSYAISLYLSKAWQCNVIVNDLKTRLFFYSGKPMITYIIIINYQYNYLSNITNPSNFFLINKISLIINVFLSRRCMGTDIGSTS